MAKVIFILSISILSSNLYAMSEEEASKCFDDAYTSRMNQRLAVVEMFISPVLFEKINKKFSELPGRSSSCVDLKTKNERVMVLLEQAAISIEDALRFK